MKAIHIFTVSVGFFCMAVRYVDGKKEFSVQRSGITPVS